MAEPALTSAALAARQAFPTGLAQPRGGSRVSLDPLLLAAFARPKRNARAADLGTGCGVAALALLLTHSTPKSATGFDIDPAMVDAASRNAGRLGLEGMFEARELDLKSIREAVRPESFDCALANPPYREPGTGLPCQGQERNRARFATSAGLSDFLAAASWLLANRGCLNVVFPAARLAGLLRGCLEARLAPKRLRLVHSRLDEPARLVLLECVKNAGEELAVEPPLALYEGRGEETRMTQAALEFCPFLAKNP